MAFLPHPACSELLTGYFTLSHVIWALSGAKLSPGMLSSGTDSPGPQHWGPQPPEQNFLFFFLFIFMAYLQWNQPMNHQFLKTT